MPRETSPITTESRRSKAARANGRKGGLATAEKHGPEWLKARALKGGQTTRDLYSVAYYAHINQQRKMRAGWPQGKLRNAARVVEAELRQGELSVEVQAALTHMLGH